MIIGVLALQGDFASHTQILQRCGVAQVIAVRDIEALQKCDGLIIPGGESTVMSRLCDRYELWKPLQDSINSGMPVLGTCAGMIMLSKNISGASQNFAQKTLGVLDIDVARNAYGRQIESFETDLEIPALKEIKGSGKPLHAAFIRAPQITRVGENVEVLATHNNYPVAVRQDKIMALSFHPEVSGEARLHQLWLSKFPGGQS